MTLRRYSGVSMTSMRSSSGTRHEVVLDEVARATGPSRRGRPRGPPSKSAGWSALMRSTTSASDGVRVDLAGGRDPGRLLLGQLLPAELEDRVGVEAVEGAVRDERVVPLAADRPVVGAARRGSPRASVAVQLDGDLGARRSPGRAGDARRPASDALGGGRRSRRRSVGSSAAVSSSMPCHGRTCGTVARVLARLQEAGARPRGGR